MHLIVDLQPVDFVVVPSRSLQIGQYAKPPITMIVNHSDQLAACERTIAHISHYRTFFAVLYPPRIR